MKLLFCPVCWDVFKLKVGKLRQCECGRVKGRYIDNQMAEVSEDGISIAIGNGSLENAIYDMRELQQKSNDTAGRQAYYTDRQGRISHAWVRPNSGPGNPHCKIMEADNAAA